MQKTVLITGTSSGIGKATAQYFAQQGWNVAATVRQPEDRNTFTDSFGIRVFQLDVTNPENVQRVMKQALESFGQIDAVVNNAGVAALGAFETARPEVIERQFATNVFGPMHLTRAILPHFRQRRSGILVNVTSMGGRLAFPLFSAYHASKFALEGFSESLQYELEPFNIRVKIIEPGAFATNLFRTAIGFEPLPGISDYTGYQQAYLEYAAGAAGESADPVQVAQIIYQAVTDDKKQLRYVVGNDARQLLEARYRMSEEDFFRMIQPNLPATT